MSTTIRDTHSRPPDTGRSRQKARTREQLIAATTRLLAAGRQPSVSEAADAARVSRRTAYRYFPTQEKLHAEAVLDRLRPAMDAAIAAAPAGTDSGSLEVRVNDLVVNMQRLALENESLLRTMIHQTVLQPTAGRQARRGTRRLDWIEAALKPLNARLAGAAHARLVSALALCTGIEAVLVLRDICGLSPQGAIELSQWLAAAALSQSLRESVAAKSGRRSSRAAPVDR